MALFTSRGGRSPYQYHVNHFTKKALRKIRQQYGSVRTDDIVSFDGTETSSATYVTVFNVSGIVICALAGVVPDETNQGGMKLTVDGSVVHERSSGMQDRDNLVGPWADWGTDRNPTWPCPAVVISGTSMKLEIKRTYGTGNFTIWGLYHKVVAT